MADDPDLAALVASLGPDEVGRRYAERLAGRLAEIAAGQALAAMEEAPGDEEWIDDAVIWGEDLDSETRLRLVVAARESSPDDDCLWCIGDMPADHLVGDDFTMANRLHRKRSVSPRVDRMFIVMQDALRRDGHDLGWWSDDKSRRRP